MIDTSEMIYKDSRWQDLFAHLKKRGFDVNEPGIKVGECIRPYVVVRYDGSSRHPSFSTDVALYSVMCYVPKSRYSMLEPFVRSVKGAMKELEPLFKQQGQETASYYDAEVKAHMVSVSYKNYKKL